MIYIFGGAAPLLGVCPRRVVAAGCDGGACKHRPYDEHRGGPPGSSSAQPMQHFLLSIGGQLGGEVCDKRWPNKDHE